MVAVHERCPFEWSAHEEAARAAGLQEGQIRQIQDGTPPTGLSEAQRQALVAVDMMLRHRTLDDMVYQETAQALGRAGLAELIWLTGYYVMLALALAVFNPAAWPGERSAR